MSPSVDARPRPAPAAITGREQLDVGAAGDLGHDAAEAGVQVDLARHHRRQHVVRRRPRPPPPSRRTTSRCRGSGSPALDRDVTLRRAVRDGACPAIAGLDGAARRSAYPAVVDVVGPHHQGVLVVLGVVALADAGRGEAERRYIAWAPALRHAHLERELLRRPAATRLRRASCEQQPGADLAAVPGRVDGDGGDVAVVGDQHQPGVADDRRARPGRRGRRGWSRSASSLMNRPSDHGRGYTCASMRSTPRRWRRRIGATIDVERRPGSSVGLGRPRDAITPPSRVDQLISASGLRR